MRAQDRIGSRRPERRDEILRAARAVIERKGLEGASLRAIAHEIGCTTGILTHHFANKQELIAAAVDAVFRPFDTAVAPKFEGEDARRRLRRVFVSVLPVDAENRSVLRLWMQLARHTWSSRSFATRYRQRYAAIRAAVEAVLREGQSSGEFRADLEPAAECDTLCALFDGLAVAALADPARFPPTRLYELIDRQIDKLLTPSAETERRTRSSESAAANRRPARRAR